MVERRRRRVAGRAGLVLVLTALAGLTFLTLLGAARPTAAAPAQIDQELPQPPDPGSRTDGADETAREILDDPAYRDRGNEKSPLQRLRDWILDRLPDLDPPNPTGGRRGDVIAYVLAVVIGLGAVAAIVWGLAHTRRRRKLDSDADPDHDGEIEVIPLRSTDEWTSEAERLEAAGQWRLALRARYRAAVGLLVDRELVTDLPGRTPAEHAREVHRTVPEASQPFDAGTKLFEQVWFGSVETGPAEVARFRDLAAEVAAEVRRVPAARPEQDDPTEADRDDADAEAPAR